MAGEQFADGLAASQEAHFARINHHHGIPGIMWQLPGLRGLWPMGAVDASGNVQDVSGHGHHLTYNGNPTFNVLNNLTPYIDLDGTGDYLSRADEADLDILGTESYIASGLRGLTFGGWFYPADVSGIPTFLGKHDNVTSSNSSYLLMIESGTSRMYIYNSTSNYGVSGATLSINTWYFICGRFTPSTEIAIWTNVEKATFTTSIPASANNSSATFGIGGRGGGNLLTGRGGLSFLCAAALPDNLIYRIYHLTKGLYGIKQ